MRKGHHRWFLLHPYPSMRTLRRGGKGKILKLSKKDKANARPFRDVIVALRAKGIYNEETGRYVQCRAK